MKKTIYFLLGLFLLWGFCVMNRHPAYGAVNDQGFQVFSGNNSPLTTVSTQTVITNTISVISTQTIVVISTNDVINIATGTFFCSTGTVQTSALGVSTIAYHSTPAGQTSYIENMEGSVVLSTTTNGSIQILGYLVLNNSLPFIAQSSIPFVNTLNGYSILPQEYSKSFYPPLPLNGAPGVAINAMTATNLNWTVDFCGYDK